MIRYAALPESPSPSQCLSFCLSHRSQFMSACLPQAPLCISSTVSLLLYIYATPWPSHTRKQKNTHPICTWHKHPPPTWTLNFSLYSFQLSSISQNIFGTGLPPQRLNLKYILVLAEKSELQLLITVALRTVADGCEMILIACSFKRTARMRRIITLLSYFNRDID